MAKKEKVEKVEIKKTPSDLLTELMEAINASNNPRKLTILQTLKTIKEEI